MHLLKYHQTRSCHLRNFLWTRFLPSLCVRCFITGCSLVVWQRLPPACFPRAGDKIKRVTHLLKKLQLYWRTRKAYTVFVFEICSVLQFTDIQCSRAYFCRFSFRSAFHHHISYILRQLPNWIQRRRWTMMNILTSTCIFRIQVLLIFYLMGKLDLVY